MKAIELHRYGPPEVLCYDTVTLPKLRADEVLVKIAATSVNPKDCLIRRGKFRLLSGYRFPLRLGNDLAGNVVDRGRSVRDLSLGQPVFGMTNRMVGRAYADYVAIRASEVAPAPATISLVEAGALPLVSQTALQALRDLGAITQGSQVCINGASGGVGTVAIQIAKAYGAQVTAMCSSRNEALCRQLGADQVVPYDERDVLAGATSFDIYFVSTVPSPASAWAALRTRWSKQRARVVVVRSRRHDLATIAGLVEKGQLTPVIDQTLPLSEAAQAHAYVQTKRARGKVLLIPS